MATINYVGLILLLPLLHTPYTADGALNTIIDQCCEIGRSWFTQSRERCSAYPTPIAGISAEDTMSCQSLIELCCLHKKEEKQCTRGKQIARIRRTCVELHSQVGNEDAKHHHSMAKQECCHCCKLGLVAQDAHLPCTMLTQFGSQCSQVFEECCHGNPNEQPATTPAPVVTEFPGINVCAKFPGQLCGHICNPTPPNSYLCSCREGFTLLPDGRTCRQQTVSNRCLLNNPCDHNCVDTGIATQCTCNDGFRLQPDGMHCVDVDECLIGTHSCFSNQECVNTQGSYRCEDQSTTGGDGSHTGGGTTGEQDCPTGYTWNSLTRLCEETTNAQQCPAGFAWNSLTRLCEDIDECTLNHHNCRTGQTCINHPGSFLCQTETSGGHTQTCGVGFKFNRITQTCEDINECAMSHDTCVQGQQCENTVGSYVCRREISCGTGYTLDRDTQQCVDDDECELETHNCGAAYDCQNVLGSFRCLRKQCPPGYRLDITTGVCQAVICSRGMKPDVVGNCVDINECIEHPNVCRTNQECQNTPGSYVCRNLVNCGPGFELTEDGGRCIDINECVRGTHDCNGAQMTCVNRPGTYHCVCADGYQLDHRAKICEDIDECERFAGQVCAQTATCTNTQGSFLCTCKEGFSSVNNGRSCTDVDECLQTGLCQHSCRNTWGSYQCQCQDGYTISDDGRSCTDVDECETWKNRGGQLCIGLCENTPGSYTCACPEGYRMLGDSRTCQDIDECAEGSANCDGPNDFCINTRGGIKCETIECPTGFVRAPSLGKRNNYDNIRCQRQTFVCPQGDTECLYAPLSYSVNFITFPSRIRIPADLFTMRGPLSPYRRLEFDLKLNSAVDPKTGEMRVSRDFFHLKTVSRNEVVIQLLREIDGPQDVELELNMNIHSSEFSQRGGEEVFFGTAVAKIKIYVTGDDW